MDATERINQLISITSDLADLLARENEALREHRPREIEGLVAEKTSLSRAYEAHVHELTANVQILLDVEPEVQEQLRDLGVKVNALMGENTRLLKAAILANRRVIELVADAVKAHKAGAGTYSAKGAVDHGGRAPAPRNVAVSVDRSL